MSKRQDRARDRGRDRTGGGGRKPKPRASAGNVPPELPLWKKVTFALIAVFLVFAILEGILALFGVQPRLSHEDPFVGFVSNIPLFVESRGADGRPEMVTGANKRGFFNTQSFAREKAPGTFRIFCLGGSTTYGRPYADATSFVGWLRELLPQADPARRWEVVNAGGISYASYRVAQLMEELVRYDPDLFVIYTGHNEFLEERTYGALRDTPAAIRTASAWLARTRTGAALNALMNRAQGGPTTSDESRTLLATEVQAKLDHSAGPELYERDDILRDSIVTHYRFSLQRMVDLASAAEATILFVTPASNLKDFSPFKSQHSDGLNQDQMSRAEALLQSAREHLHGSRWDEALAAADEGLGFDPRNAEMRYRRGKALIGLDRIEEAGAAFTSARDEDVCPLRALTSMQTAVAEIAAESGAMLVDYADLIEQRARAEFGHGIAGEEYFLDHVHPTIEGHRILAVALIESMAHQGLIRLRDGWGEEAVAEVAARVEAGIEPEVHARALGNLALTLDWAGKQEDSRRLAFQALASGAEDPTILMMVARHLALEGESDEALSYFRRAMRANPNNPVVHSQLAMLYAGRQELEAAAAHFFLASLLWQDNETYHQQLGVIMATRGRYATALASLERARQLNPKNERTLERIASVRSQLGDESPPSTPPKLAVTRFDSGYPRTIGQTRSDASGRDVLHGIWTEWYDGGALKSFVDYTNGVPDGVSATWDESGRPVERTATPEG